MRGGLSPFLASRRLVRRQDLMQLVLPLLLATAMAAFAASAWKVADDWRVSKAAATIGASTVYYTDTPPARLQWVTQQVDPEGQYLAAAVPPGAAHRRRWPGGAGRREPLRPGGGLGLAVGDLRRERGAGLADVARRARPDPVQRVARPGGAARHRAPAASSTCPWRCGCATSPTATATSGWPPWARCPRRVRRRWTASSPIAPTGAASSSSTCPEARPRCRTPRAG